MTMINYIKANHLSLLIIAFLVFSSFFGAASQTPGFGVSPPANLTITSNPYQFNNTTIGVRTASTTVTNALTIGTGGGLATRVSAGACITSTSTIFAATNPFSATSTAAVTLWGTQGATTTDILVGTSTNATAGTGLAVATSSVNASLIGAFNVSTSSQFYFVSGITNVSSTGGFTAANSGTYPTSMATILVAPGGSIVGFSTSTWGGQTAGVNGATGSGKLGVPSSCNYKVTWNR